MARWLELYAAIDLVIGHVFSSNPGTESWKAFCDNSGGDLTLSNSYPSLDALRQHNFVYGPCNRGLWRRWWLFINNVPTVQQRWAKTLSNTHNTHSSDKYTVTTSVTVTLKEKTSAVKTWPFDLTVLFMFSLLTIKVLRQTVSWCVLYTTGSMLFTSCSITIHNKGSASGSTMSQQWHTLWYRVRLANRKRLMALAWSR